MIIFVIILIEHKEYIITYSIMWLKLLYRQDYWIWKSEVCTICNSLYKGQPY